MSENHDSKYIRLDKLTVHIISLKNSFIHKLNFNIVLTVFLFLKLHFYFLTLDMDNRFSCFEK